MYTDGVAKHMRSGGVVENNREALSMFGVEWPVWISRGPQHFQAVLALRSHGVLTELQHKAPSHSSPAS